VTAPTAAAVPATHRDLLDRPVHGVLATMGADGMPQSSVVWVAYDGECVEISTTLERQKGRNMSADPRVALLVVDPANSARWIAVRGRVREMTSDGAEALTDELTRLYCPGKTHFYGDVYPVEQRDKETRVIARIEPRAVSVDAIFG
jgi:PPOX class probable F420-dependent enzyme